MDIAWAKGKYLKNFTCYLIEETCIWTAKKQLFRQRKSTKAQTGLVTLTLLRCRHYGPRIFARYFWYTGVLLRDLPSQADHSQVRGRLSNNNISACRVVNWLSWVGYTTHIWCSRGLNYSIYLPTYFHFFTTRLPTQRKKLRQGMQKDKSLPPPYAQSTSANSTYAVHPTATS